MFKIKAFLCHIIRFFVILCGLLRLNYVKDNHMLFINITFACILAIRFYSLSISIRHEKALIAKGAIQYGKRNSTLLSIAHVVFYFAAIIEANNQNLSFNSTSQIGLAILIFAIAICSLQHYSQ